MDQPTRPTDVRAAFHTQLHVAYRPHAFDNWLVWAGNHTVRIDGTEYPPALARAYVGIDHPACSARVRVELFVSAVPTSAVRPGDVDARLWTDANQRGAADARGVFGDAPGRYLDMHLVCDDQGVALPAGTNLVFESEPFVLNTTGVFSYSVDFSADDPASPSRRWVSLSELANNRNGVIVVSPTWVRDCPTVAEICVRKVGARMVSGRFRSGTLPDVTAALPGIPADVVYLLPFFRIGTTDLHTGADVRKGQLGSPYAVQDFFQIDPELIVPPEECDLGALVRDGLITAADAAALGLPDVSALAGTPVPQLAARLGVEPLRQAVGRAQLRALTRQAHALGKRVIFDLVLMQTSRDCPLIRQHPEWYALDTGGVPRIHQIAWLVYSDVALFDLVFNEPLQEYLGGVAPYWITQCGLDGVRIDASQTVDRPFLKRIKNRVNAAQAEALVLGETLCPLAEAVDVPVDMVYALLVDFHRDVEHATPYIDFLEQMHGRFAPGTVALAYFENHDSPRATRAWRDKYHSLLNANQPAAAWWLGRGDALRLALLKNLQASLIDCSAGYAGGSNLTGGLEWGSWWGEPESTDFLNATVLDASTRLLTSHAELESAHAQLQRQQSTWREVRAGLVYYHRAGAPGGDPDDRVLAYTRYDREGALLFLHNLDGAAARQVRLDFAYLPWQPTGATLLFDSHAALGLAGAGREPGQVSQWHLDPLQSLVVRLAKGEPRA